MSIRDAGIMTDLKRFIESQKMLAATQAQVGWTRRRERWVSELALLFGWIGHQLEAAGLGQDAFEQPSVKLHEESLGHYEAPSLSVRLPTGLWVDFNPRATVIIGGYGRIDVQSRHALKQIRLIALDADEDRDSDDQMAADAREWAWRVFPATGTAGSYPLDAAGLGQIFADLLN